MPNRWHELHADDRFDLRYPSEHVVRFLRRQPKHEAVLDVGCGTGRHCRAAFEMGFTKIVACDVSLNGLQRAYTKLPMSIYQQAQMWALPYRTGAFGTVVANHSLYYSDEDGLRLALKECQRVLRPGGQAYIALRSDTDWRASLPADPVGFSARYMKDNAGSEEGMTITFISQGQCRLLFRPWRTVDIGRETLVHDGREESYFNVVATA